MGYRWARVISAMFIACLVATSAVASATVKQRTYDGASEDTRIFLAILTESMDEAVTMLDAGARGQGDQVQRAATELNRLNTGFSQDLLAIILRDGTGPIGIQALWGELSAFNNAAQSLARADSEARFNLSLAGSLQSSAERGAAVEGALLAIARERGAIDDLRLASGAFANRGASTTELLRAADALEAALLTFRTTLEAQASQLDLPALLILTADRHTVEIGGRFVASGLALRGGEPAVATTVVIGLGGREFATLVDVEGRFRSVVGIPLSDLPGVQDLTAEAMLNGTRSAAGPIAIQVLPASSRVSLSLATTTPGAQDSVGYSGRLSTGPFPPAGREVVLYLNGEPVATTVADERGEFSGNVFLRSGPKRANLVHVAFLSTDPRIASAESPPITVLLTLENAPASQARFQEFFFPTTGLGLVADLLAGMILVGLSVFAYHAFVVGDASVAVRRWRHRFAFRRMVKFGVATDEDKRKADPRNAFPPDGSMEAGPLFAHFVESLRKFEQLPASVTHWEVVGQLKADGVSDPTATEAARLYEHMQYVPDERKARDTAPLRRQLVELWNEFLRARGLRG